jgi:hypothetical protein
VRKIVLVAVAFHTIVDWRKKKANSKSSLSQSSTTRTGSRFSVVGVSIFLVAGLLLCAAVVVIRMVDGRSPGPGANAPTVGVYLTGNSSAQLSPIVSPELVGNGVRPRSSQWSVDIRPGEIATVRFVLVLLDAPGVWHYSINKPLQVVFILPDGSVPAMDRTTLADGAGGRCAQWYDGRQVHVAYARSQRSATGGTYVTCDIPAVGRVKNLFLEYAATWKDWTRESIGFARSSSELTVPYVPQIPFDVSIVRRSADSTPVLDSEMSLELVMADGERLIDSFPSPSGGKRGERTWLLPQGGDIHYALERAAKRWWVQPALDIATILSGVLLGLAMGVAFEVRRQGIASGAIG